MVLRYRLEKVGNPFPKRITFFKLPTHVNEHAGYSTLLFPKLNLFLMPPLLARFPDSGVQRT